MTTHVTGQAAAVTAVPTLHVGTYRRALLAAVIGNPLFSEAEQLRTNHNAHDCQDAAKLALWTKNANRVAAEREAADLARTEGKPTVAPVRYLTRQQEDKLLTNLACPAFVAEYGTYLVSRQWPLTVAEAAQALVSLGKGLTGATAPTYATEAQCEEIYQLAQHPTLTACEKSQALVKLPLLTQPEAVRYIGRLYGKILHRGGTVAGSDGSTSVAA